MFPAPLNTRQATPERVYQQTLGSSLLIAALGRFQLEGYQGRSQQSNSHFQTRKVVKKNARLMVSSV
jgi:hypothetical protein